EVSDRRSDRDVATDGVVDAASVHQLPPGLSNTGVGEVDGNVHLLRALPFHRERLRRRPVREWNGVDEYRVAHRRRIETEVIRVLDTQNHIQRSASESDAGNFH